MTEISAEKQRLRKKILLRREARDCRAAAVNAAKARECLVNSLEWRNASAIFTFVSMTGEFPSNSIIEEAWEQGKTVAAPKVLGKRRMVFHAIANWNDLKPGTWGILEPRGQLEIMPEKSDLLLAPGLAFDMAGWRLGYGGGFYDSYLASLKERPVTLGLCFAWQIVDLVPHDKYDISLSGLCSENGIVWCQN